MAVRSIDLLKALLQFLGIDLYLLAYDNYKEPDVIYPKPFLKAYTCLGSFMFTIAFVFILQFCRNINRKGAPDNYEEVILRQEEEVYYSQVPSLSDSSFVPIRDASSGTESDDSGLHAVRFNREVEVREMSAYEASDALFARLSYNASVRVSRMRTHERTAKTALVFSLMLLLTTYLSNVAHEMADPLLVNSVIAATTPLFVLMLAAIFPSASSDRLMPMKLIAVALQMYGAAMLIAPEVPSEIYTRGMLLALFSAFFYAACIVFLKRRNNTDFRIDLLFFMGFVGFWIFMLTWPIIFILHFLRIETFELPLDKQALFIPQYMMSVGVPLVIWLSACLTTSTLLGSLALMQPIALRTFSKYAGWRRSFWETKLLTNDKFSIPAALLNGCTPMLLAFLIVIIIMCNDGDPLLEFCRLIYRKLINNRRRHLTTRANDVEQQESLISSGSE